MQRENFVPASVEIVKFSKDNIVTAATGEGGE